MVAGPRTTTDHPAGAMNVAPIAVVCGVSAASAWARRRAVVRPAEASANIKKIGHRRGDGMEPPVQWPIVAGSR